MNAPAQHSGPRHGGHGHFHKLRHASRTHLRSALVLRVGGMLIEIIGGILSGSLALLANAGPMLTEAVSIALALAAMQFATRRPTAKHTFGYYRLEILAALMNALTLCLVSVWVVTEAFHRMQEVPEVEGRLVVITGVISLVLNVIATRILRRSAKQNINVRVALRHVVAFRLGTIGISISGILVWAFGWTLADPIISVGIGILIFFSTWRLLGNVVNMLLEGTPEHIDVYKLCARIEEVEGVTLIHDVHVWTIAPHYETFTAHVLIDPYYQGDLDELRHRLRDIAAHDFGISHITLQLEKSRKGCTEDHHVDHLVGDVGG